MFAIPRDLVPSGPPQITGLGCPECPGTLEVTAEGEAGYLAFRCRIGHTYSANDVLFGKERAVEKHLWDAVCALEELAMLLDDLRTHAGYPASSVERSRLRERAARARAEAETLRRFTEENYPLQIDVGRSSSPTAG